MTTEPVPWTLANLKPGDEVGARWQSLCGEAVAVYRVVAIHEGGVIETDNEDFFHPDGRAADGFGPIAFGRPKARLCEPTDEGRRAMLMESIGVDLDILGGKMREMTLDELNRLREAVSEWTGEEMGQPTTKA